MTHMLLYVMCQALPIWPDPALHACAFDFSFSYFCGIDLNL